MQNYEKSNIVAENKVDFCLILGFYMSRKKWFYILFFISLALVFYLVLSLVIPGFNKKKIEPVSEVQPFSFVDQDGKVFTQKDVAGKVYVAEYFFTHCPGICPQMNKNMQLVYAEMKNEKDFLILSHTSDPDRDSSAQLKHYADSMGVDTRHWIFLTGEKLKLYEAARVSYTIDDPANNLKSIDDQFVHSQFWALVDKKGEVRKVYDGLKPTEVKRLISDAKDLIRD